MIYIQTIRKNDIGEDHGKQIELGKAFMSICKWTSEEISVDITFRSLDNQPWGAVNGHVINTKFKVRGTERGGDRPGVDCKEYANANGELPLKDFFTSVLHIDNSKEGKYYFVLEATNSTCTKFNLYMIDETALATSLCSQFHQKPIVFGDEVLQEEEREDSSFQQIFYGAPGTGKSHEVKKITGEIDGSKPNVFRTTFHPDTDYASFVGCYKPVMKPVPENLRAVAGREEDIAYEFVPQAFTDAYIYAYNHTEETTYLVIEEINRGNCAQIFGDLFQLLDRNENGTSDYSIKADKDLAKYLSNALNSEDGIKDGKLSLPANLRILATMNTSDQSLFPIDSAFKRRWDWEYVAIKYAEPKSSAFTITIEGTSFRWVDFIKVVNQRIYDVTQSEDKQMGNFFIKSSVNQKQFCSKVMFYLWNEVLKDEVENSKYFFYQDKGNNQTSKFTFTDVYGGDAASVLTSFMKYLGVTPLQKTE